MAIVNHAKREINAKIVYFGREGAGKGTSLRYVYDRIKPSLRGEFKILPTAGSELIFFDFSPFEQPVINGYHIRFHIYTFHGKVGNPAAWKMTLKGTDGLMLVADASTDELPMAQQSVSQLRDFLNSYGVGLDDIPVVLQLNKADIANRVTPADTAMVLGLTVCNTCVTTATRGDGVLEALTTLSRQVLQQIKESGVIPQPLDHADAAYNSENCLEPVTNDNEPDGPSPAGIVSVNVADDEPLTVCRSDDSSPQVNVAEGGVCIEGTTVRIPLDVTQSGGTARLTVTVTIGQG